MKLVDHDVVKPVCGQTVQIAAVVTVYRAEQVVVLLGGRASDEDVTKVLIAEDRPIGTEGLTENLLAMRDKE